MEEFANALAQMLRERVNATVSVQITEVTKVNDQKLHALNITKENERISRNFYIDMYYRNYQEGVSLERIADSILGVYNTDENPLNESSMDIVQNIHSYDAIKDRIILRLINKDRNSEYLEDKAYVEYLDFAVCFCIMMELGDEGMATIAVPKSALERWGVLENDVLETAITNSMALLPAKIDDLASVLKNMMNADSFSQYMNPPELGESIGMYIMTNEKGTNGAATILYRDLLCTFAQEHCVNKVYIIPSSVHELILIPETDGLKTSIDDLNDMVVSVNGSEVSPAEVLGDHVYVYEYETDTINY